MQRYAVALNTMETKYMKLWYALLLAMVATAAQASRLSLRRVESDLVSETPTSGMETLLDGWDTIFEMARRVYDRVHGYIDSQPRSREEDTTNPPARGKLWALLIAGSAGFGNYRHQADVAHVCDQKYRVLVSPKLCEDVCVCVCAVVPCVA